MDERIAALTAQIEKLQAENTFLKCLLDEVGISYVLPASKPTAEISKQLPADFIPISGDGRMFTANAV